MPIYPVGPEATPSLPLSTWADVSGVGTQATQRRRREKREEKDLETPNQRGGGVQTDP